MSKSVLPEADDLASIARDPGLPDGVVAVIEESTRQIATLTEEISELEHKLQGRDLELAETSAALGQLRRQIEELARRSPEKPRQQLLDDLDSLAETARKSSTETIDRNILLDSVTSDFYTALRERHADLTPGDVRLAGLIRAGLDRQEICRLLHISPEGLKKRRWRMRRRLGLRTGSQLERYLAEIG